MFPSAKIVTGEKIQQQCEKYFGTPSDFLFNPKTGRDTWKHHDVTIWNDVIDNPKLLFCYSRSLPFFAAKVHLLKNEFVLVTHNSDHCVDLNDESVKRILNSGKCLKWFAQNLVSVSNNIVLPLPIGIANSQWQHGNLQVFDDGSLHMHNTTKTKPIYFQFKIQTCPSKRNECFAKVAPLVPWLPSVPPSDNLIRLKEYQFCICPEGNGPDTHRFWEALYVRTVPIVLKSNFIANFQMYHVPMVALDKWEDLATTILRYEDYDFTDPVFLGLIDMDLLRESIVASSTTPSATT